MTTAALSWSMGRDPGGGRSSTAARHSARAEREGRWACWRVTQYTRLQHSDSSFEVWAPPETGVLMTAPMSALPVPGRENAVQEWKLLYSSLLLTFSHAVSTTKCFHLLHLLH
ncbi:hypothetical protein MHYP_G00111400 [Metynnis hypsauchen]